MMETFSQLQEMYPMYQIIVTILTLALFLMIRRFFSQVVLKRALLHNFDSTRSAYIKKAVRVGLGLIFMVLLGMIWEVSLEGLSVYIASIVTIVGVGLFATWSIVSNITASVILFFFFPFKIGSKVRIVDGDNSADGVVASLSLFSIKLIRDDGSEIFYPNNMAIQRSIIDLKG